MARFLHVSDIHLGFDRYDSSERTLDFFLAFRDALQRYGVDEKVDFVLLCGDLFEHRNIQPAVLNQAKLALTQLQRAGIPVLAIEGNHDNRPYNTKTSWLRYLAGWDLLILLEPGDPSQGDPLYSPWDPQHKRGGYLDLDCGVRVVGSNWYGASAPQAIAQIAAALGEIPPAPGPTVMMFHHGMEGQIARYQGALRYNDVLPLRSAGVDYLALGHIHKRYELEGWIFNPGSVEANNIEESDFERGVYLVEISDQGIQAELKSDYDQRPMLRLKVTTQGDESAAEVAEMAQREVQRAIQTGKLDPAQQPVVEIRLEGRVGFDRSELDVKKLQQDLQQLSQALIMLVKYNVESVEYATPLLEGADRLQVEHEVFMDLLMAHHHYKGRSQALAQGLIDLKSRQMEGQSEPELYAFVQTLLGQS